MTNFKIGGINTQVLVTHTTPENILVSGFAPKIVQCPNPDGARLSTPESKNSAAPRPGSTPSIATDKVPHSQKQFSSRRSKSLAEEDPFNTYCRRHITAEQRTPPTTARDQSVPELHDRKPYKNATRSSRARRRPAKSKRP